MLLRDKWVARGPNGPHRSSSALMGISRSPKRADQIDVYRASALRPYLHATPLWNLAEPAAVGEDAGDTVAEESVRLVFAPYLLQEIADYRSVIRTWFQALSAGGHLVIVVPHAFLYDRQDHLPSGRNGRALRLYTAKSLAEECEEALSPNSYRIRWLGDLDTDYDYGSDVRADPTGLYDVAIVVERIVPPGWPLARCRGAPQQEPPNLFEIDRIRVEHAVPVRHQRVLLLKLDHLGDFLMAIPAMERLRSALPTAQIVIVVGTWNRAAAVELGIFDEVLTFDAFAANSTEEPKNIRDKKGEFDGIFTASFDLVIDLRTDSDTRFLLESLKADFKAGLGSPLEFPFLDIFLPIEQSRYRQETAFREKIGYESFAFRESICRATRFQIESAGGWNLPGKGAMIWGPYRALAPGAYCFEPLIEMVERNPGALRVDVALDGEKIGGAALNSSDPFLIRFNNEKPNALFEFRCWPADWKRVPAFRFYGGILTKSAASSVLHQSEYLILLIELIIFRINHAGLLGEN